MSTAVLQVLEVERKRERCDNEFYQHCDHRTTEQRYMRPQRNCFQLLRFVNYVIKSVLTTIERYRTENKSLRNSGGKLLVTCCCKICCKHYIYLFRRLSVQTKRRHAISFHTRKVSKQSLRFRTCLSSLLHQNDRQHSTYSDYV